MSFRGVWLTPEAAVNRRSWTGMRSTQARERLRQSSCRPDMTLNLGAIRMNDGTVRGGIQEQDGSAVVAATGFAGCRR